MRTGREFYETVQLPRSLWSYYCLARLAHGLPVTGRARGLVSRTTHLPQEVTAVRTNTSPSQIITATVRAFGEQTTRVRAEYGGLQDAAYVCVQVGSTSRQCARSARRGSKRWPGAPRNRVERPPWERDYGLPVRAHDVAAPTSEGRPLLPSRAASSQVTGVVGRSKSPTRAHHAETGEWGEWALGHAYASGVGTYKHRPVGFTPRDKGSRRPRHGKGRRRRSGPRPSRRCTSRRRAASRGRP